MKRSYSNFTAEDLPELGLNAIQDYLFETVNPLMPSQWLLDTFDLNQEIPMVSEKARSELLITPILVEMRKKNPHAFTYFSGYQFNIDPKKGLKGFCDFIVSKRWNAAFIESPVIAIVEAKHNQDLLDAVPQCAAEMYAARLYNERHNEDIKIMHGAVTNGYEWLFLTLKDTTVAIDINRYTINNLPELLGVWQLIIDSFT
jgi:hypothetical protein